MNSFGQRSFWQDRPVFVTGGTGLLGSWLVKQLLESGANVVCLVRDWVPQSELVRSGRIEQVNTVRGDIADRDLIERALGEYEVEIVFLSLSFGDTKALAVLPDITLLACHRMGPIILKRC